MSQYKGFSSLTGDGLRTLVDSDLVHQDLLNHFMTRKREVITDPEYGFIGWDLLFEKNTPEIENLIKEDVIRIINSETRVSLVDLQVIYNNDSTNPGYTINAILKYVGSQINRNFVLNFNKSLVDNGF